MTFFSAQNRATQAPLPAGSGNRRTYYRQPIYSTINLRIPGVRAPIVATLVDLSGGGCLINTRTMLQERYPVQFDLVNAAEAKLTLTGRIRKARYTRTDHTFHYGVEFSFLDETEREELLRFISHEQRRTLTGRVESTIRSASYPRDLRNHHRVDTSFPVQCNVSGLSHPFVVDAVDVSAGGMRVLTGRILRQEWAIELRFTLPNDVLRKVRQFAGGNIAKGHPFNEMSVTGQALPGLTPANAQFIQRLTFHRPNPHTISELQRFVNAVRLLVAEPRQN